MCLRGTTMPPPRLTLTCRLLLVPSVRQRLDAPAAMLPQRLPPWLDRSLRRPLSCAGKSCLLDRYVTVAFETDVKNTVGSAFAAKRVRASLSRVASSPLLCHRDPASEQLLLCGMDAGQGVERSDHLSGRLGHR